MSKIKLLLDVVDNMRCLADSLEILSKSITSEEKEEVIKHIKLEDVRKVLAEKSQHGFTEEVRNVILKYGADKLSEVKEEDYENLLKDAEEIGNE